MAETGGSVRSCQSCQKELPVSFFSLAQLSKLSPSCRDCRVRYATYKKATESRVCHGCSESVVSTRYSFNQWLKGRDKSRCTSCIDLEAAYRHDTVGRRCANCHLPCASSEYTLEEWLKGDTLSKCHDCVTHPCCRLCGQCGIHTIVHGQAHCESCLYPWQTLESNIEIRTCFVCRERLEANQFRFEQWEVVDSECLSCEAVTISYQSNQCCLCGGCQERLHAIDYTLPEWRQGQGVARCRACMASSHDTNDYFVPKQPKGWDELPIPNCHASLSLATGTRVCASCHQLKKCTAFSKPQLKRAEGVSSCKACLFQVIGTTQDSILECSETIGTETTLVGLTPLGRKSHHTSAMYSPNETNHRIAETLSTVARRACISCANVYTKDMFSQSQWIQPQSHCRHCERDAVLKRGWKCVQCGHTKAASHIACPHTAYCNSCVNSVRLLRPSGSKVQPSRSISVQRPNGPTELHQCGQCRKNLPSTLFSIRNWIGSPLSAQCLQCVKSNQGKKKKKPPKVKKGAK